MITAQTYTSYVDVITMMVPTWSPSEAYIQYKSSKPYVELQSRQKC